MKKQYGAKKGKDVYYAVEQKQKTAAKKKKKQKWKSPQGDNLQGGFFFILNYPW